jgi:DNA polymerase zeta
LFVLVPGRSREEAFCIGEEIAQAVTNANPSPIKLKLEKVYQPSILQTKKRYVGYMYENKDQKEPKYEAKGIETVRRDGVPAVGKVASSIRTFLPDIFISISFSDARKNYTDFVRNKRCERCEAVRLSTI